jgi:hypothetical protein
MLGAMAEVPIAFLRAGSRPPARTVLPGGGPAQTRFDRRELNLILGIYGKMVALGEWRDYAIDFLEDRAVFSIYRHASEMPLFRVEKQPLLRTRQGEYSVVAATGHVLKRGHELTQVLRVFDRKLIKALAAENA